MADEKTEQPKGEVSFPLKAMLGEKVGMTQIFTETGQCVPVSVIFTGGCVTTGVRTRDVDGYTAVQLGVGECREKGLAKSYIAQFKKVNVAPTRWLKEFRVSNPEKFQVGQKVPIVFTPGDFVDVSGVSKGKGFAGVMKRHGFHGLPASHGASDKERSRGSSGGGSGQPQRVLKGTRMAGRMGSDWVTVMNLEVVKVDAENGLLLIKGAVPGNAQRMVIIKETSRPLKHKRPPVAVKSKKAAAPKKAAKPAAAPAAKK